MYSSGLQCQLCSLAMLTKKALTRELTTCGVFTRTENHKVSVVPIIRLISMEKMKTQVTSRIFLSKSTIMFKSVTTLWLTVQLTKHTWTIHSRNSIPVLRSTLHSWMILMILFFIKLITLSVSNILPPRQRTVLVLPLPCQRMITKIALNSTMLWVKVCILTLLIPISQLLITVLVRKRFGHSVWQVTIRFRSPMHT